MLLSLFHSKRKPIPVSEIECFLEQLNNYHITLEELIHVSPIESNTRTKAIQIAQKVAKSEHLRSSFIQNNTLPIDMLIQESIANRKIIEKHHEYITAMTLLALGNYTYVQEYIWS